MAVTVANFHVCTQFALLLTLSSLVLNGRPMRVLTGLNCVQLAEQRGVEKEKRHHWICTAWVQDPCM